MSPDFHVTEQRRVHCNCRQSVGGCYLEWGLGVQGDMQLVTWVAS